MLTKPLPRLPALIQMLLRSAPINFSFSIVSPRRLRFMKPLSQPKVCVQQLGRDWSALVNAVLRNLIRLPVPETFLIQLSIRRSICRSATASAVQVSGG